MLVRPLSLQELPAAMRLAREVFLEFVAPDYSEEGRRNFLKFLEMEQILPLVGRGELFCYGCFAGDELIGMAATLGRDQLCLLFVQGAWQRQGAARRLFAEILRHAPAGKPISVHASPCGAPAYRRLGFVGEREAAADGMRFFPMVYHPAP